MRDRLARAIACHHHLAEQPQADAGERPALRRDSWNVPPSVLAVGLWSALVGGDWLRGVTGREPLRAQRDDWRR